MKGLGEIIIYLLLIIGAVAMLMPFAWMVVTSIKLPSEVEQWPPQWGSKNFLSKREVRISKDYFGNSLTLKVDDDAFLRGKVHILFETEPSYTDNLPREKFYAIYDSYKDLFSKKPSDFNSVGDFVTYQLNFLETFLSKKKFRDVVIADIERSLKSLKAVEKMVDKRVSNESDKESISNYIHKVQGELAKLKVKAEDVYDNVELFLSKNDLEKILKVFSTFEGKVKNFPSLESKQAKLLLRFIQMKVLNPVEDSFKPYFAYMDVFNELVKVQDKKFKGREIIARFKTKDEKFESLKEALSKDYPWIWNSVKEKARKSPSALWTDIEAILGESKAKENQKILQEIKRNLRGSASEKNVLQDIEELVKKSIDVAYGKNINFEEYINCDDIEEFVSRYTEDVLKIAENMEEYKEFYKMEGLKTSLNAIRSIAKRLEKNLAVDPMKFVREAYYMDKDYRKKYDDVRKRYINAVDTMVILKNPEPNVVKSVKTYIVKGKDMTKESIGVDLSVQSINFYDEKVRVAVFFSFGEIIKNIFQNYVDAWHAAPFGRYYINTVLVASATTIFEVILASMAAFAFAILDFPGRDFIFGLFLATMMVPGEVLLVPNFITITKLGWIDTYYALIVPWIVSVFAIFLIRQHFMTLPRELYDASKIDGCSSWRYLWTIAVPLSKPVIITGALLKFVGSWNAFLWVLIVTNSDKYRTLPVGLHTFSSEAGTVYNQLMAASTFSVLPVIVLFLFLQKYFIRGIARSGLK